MSDTELTNYVKEYLTKVVDLLKEKNKRYGNSILSPIQIFRTDPGLNGVYVRLNDKFARLINQTAGEDEDVVLDIIGYLAFTAYLLRCEEDESSVSEEGAFSFFENYLIEIADSTYAVGLMHTIRKKIDVFTFVDIIPRLKDCSNDLCELLSIDAFINYLLRSVYYWEFTDTRVDVKISNVVDLIVALICREYLINERSLKIGDTL